MRHLFQHSNYYITCLIYVVLQNTLPRGGFTIEFSEMRGPNKIFGSFCKINEPNILFGPLISENSIVTPPLDDELKNFLACHLKVSQGYSYYYIRYYLNKSLPDFTAKFMNSSNHSQQHIAITVQQVLAVPKAAGYKYDTGSSDVL